MYVFYTQYYCFIFSKCNALTVGKCLLFNIVPFPPSQAVRHASTKFRKSEDRASRSIGQEENKAAWFINNSIWFRAFAERHLRPPRSRFFLVSSISSLLYFHHFRASPRSVYASIPTIELCLRDCYIRPPTITPPSSRLGFEKRRVERKGKRVYMGMHMCVLYNRNAAQKVELQFGRAQISRNDR